MEKLVPITVDERPLQVDAAVSLLQGLKNQGVVLPALCFHSAFGGNGSCGLCLVETGGENAWQVQRACLIQPRPGLQVRTGSARLKRLRGQAARLLLKRGPFRKPEAADMLLAIMVEYAADQAVTSQAITGREKNAGCILCGLCIRICQKTGRQRLAYIGRGKDLFVELLEERPGNASIYRTAGCDGCRACQRICPTGFIYPNAEQAFTNRLYR